MRRQRSSILLPMLLSFVLLTGCLSVAGQDRELVLIETEPAGAEAASVEGQRCITPCMLDVPRMKEQAVWLEKAGFLPLEMTLTGKRSHLATAASVVGNLALGTIVCAAGLALPSDEESTEGLVLAGVGVFLAFGGGVWADRDEGAHFRLTPNPLRGVLVPEAPTTVPPEPSPAPRPSPSESDP